MPLLTRYFFSIMCLCPNHVVLCLRVPAGIANPKVAKNDIVFASVAHSQDRPLNYEVR